MSKKIERPASIKRPLIGKFLDISAYHIPYSDDKILRRAAASASHAWDPIVYKYEEGQFVHVPSDKNLAVDLKMWKANGLSATFCRIMKRASDLKLWFVRFDADGMIYADLKTFDW